MEDVPQGRQGERAWASLSSPNRHLFTNLEAFQTSPFGFLQKLHYRDEINSLDTGDGFNL